MGAGTRVLEHVVPWSSLNARGGRPGRAWPRQTVAGRGDLLSWTRSSRGGAGRGATGEVLASEVLASDGGQVVIDVVERRRARFWRAAAGEVLGNRGGEVVVLRKRICWAWPAHLCGNDVRPRTTKVGRSDP
jgi:hypothetical protein